MHLVAVIRKDATIAGKECALLRAKTIIRISTAILTLALPVAGAHAEDPARSGRLYDELARMDSELFEAAFVTCDQARFSSLFVDDPEFYHDRDGLTRGEDVKKLKSCPRDNGVKRTLVAGSLAVYPIQDFGAIQIGRHTFTKAGEPGVEIAKFIHLWRYSDGQWRLARVLSFDHHQVTEQDRNAVTGDQP